MTARYVADEAALTEWFHEHASGHQQWPCARNETCGHLRVAREKATALLASGVVQPREDTVREAKAGALREAAQAISPYDAPDSARRWLRHRAAALTLTTPGTDRPAAEDGPRNTGTGSAT